VTARGARARRLLVDGVVLRALRALWAKIAPRSRHGDSAPPLRELERSLGYRFRDRSLLRTALTHTSYAHEQSPRGLCSNQLLEFLGDAVLGLVISSDLCRRFPEAEEGTLTKLRSQLVNTHSLADQARKIALGEFLLLGKGEVQTGGRSKSSILADAYEALLAAVYRDGGVQAIERVILAQFADGLARVDIEAAPNDSKSALQEKTQSRFGRAPSYVTVEELGPDHEKLFRVTVRLGDRPLGDGWGRTKKAAEQEAARDALSHFAPHRARSRGGLEI
jgi:ribonuclease III